MKLFCIIPTAWTTAGPPAGVTMPYPARRCVHTECPGDVTRTLMMVEFEHDIGGGLAWRATPGVVVLPEHYKWFRLVPPLAVTLFGPWGVVATDTFADAADKIRAATGWFRP